MTTDGKTSAPGPLHSSALAKEGNYTDQPEMAIWVHDQRLEMLNFHPPTRSNREKSPSRDITTCHTIDRDSNPPTRSNRDFVAGEERRIG